MAENGVKHYPINQSISIPNTKILAQRVIKYSQFVWLIFIPALDLSRNNACMLYDLHGYALAQESSLSNLCLWIKILHFHCMIYGHAHAQDPLSRRLWNLQFCFTLPWSLILNICLSETCPGVEKRIIKENNLFLPQNNLPLGGGSWSLQFLLSLPYRCYIPNLEWIGPVVLEEKKMLTTDDERTTTYSNRSPELFRWRKM